MTKKEDRLSPTAKQLLYEARTKYSTNPQKAIKYLKSVSPQSLNLYDRQKIGREILARYEGLGENGVDLNRIRGMYRLETAQDQERVESENRGGKYLAIHKANVKDKRELAKELKRQKNLVEEYSNIQVGSDDASEWARKLNVLGKSFRKRGMLTEAGEAYGLMNQLIEEHSAPKLFSRPPYIVMQRFFEEHPDLRPSVKTKRNTEGNLEGALASASLAIVGIFSGLFFLSSNITGNAIANVSQSSGNILGAVLLVVGLVAGFFWVKKK